MTKVIIYYICKINAASIFSMKYLQSRVIHMQHTLEQAEYCTIIVIILIGTYIYMYTCMTLNVTCASNSLDAVENAVIGDLW